MAEIVTYALVAMLLALIFAMVCLGVHIYICLFVKQYYTKAITCSHQI